MNKNRFCVYLHRLVDTLEVILVGSGTLKRPRSKQFRNKAWNEVTKTRKYTVTVVKSSLTKEESELLEVSLIRIYNPIGNTHRTTLEPKKLDTDYIDRTFYYDEDSPSCLRYKRKMLRGKGDVGDIAGKLYKEKSGDRYKVMVNGLSRFSYRVVWYLCTGEDPFPAVIDHVDGCSSNNKFGNLRKVSAAENNRNAKFRSDNKTGYKGVHLYDYGEKAYIASWCEGEVNKARRFSIMKYGKDLALGLAAECRHRMLLLQEECGVQFTERHTGQYERHKSLASFSEGEITQMLECSLFATNTTGVCSVYKSKKSWVYMSHKQNKYIRKTFSTTKYGEELAKALALEFASRIKGNTPQSVLSYSLLETNLMLEDETRSSNKSGIKGLIFRNRANGVSIVSEIYFGGKKHSKSFSIKKLGLLEAIAAAIRWRKEITV